MSIYEQNIYLITIKDKCYKTVYFNSSDKYAEIYFFHVNILLD